MAEFEGVKSASATYHQQGDHVAHVDVAWFALKPTFHEAHYHAYAWKRDCERKEAHYLAVEAGDRDWDDWSGFEREDWK